MMRSIRLLVSGPHTTRDVYICACPCPPLLPGVWWLIEAVWHDSQGLGLQAEPSAGMGWLQNTEGTCGSSGASAPEAWPAPGPPGPSDAVLLIRFIAWNETQRSVAEALAARSTSMARRTHLLKLGVEQHNRVAAAG